MLSAKTISIKSRAGVFAGDNTRLEERVQSLMAFPLPRGITPPEIIFLCEMEMVTVVPRQRLEGLELLGVCPPAIASIYIPPHCVARELTRLDGKYYGEFKLKSLLLAILKGVQIGYVRQDRNIH